MTSAVTLIFLALIFLPRYLKRGIATIPDFLEERYDKTTRIIIDFCFLIATGVCFLPIVLYSGALALNSLFHVGESLTDFSRCGYLATGNFACLVWREFCMR
ncbi:sodium:solute symporter family transporter [Escherichia coli]